MTNNHFEKIFIEEVKKDPSSFKNAFNESLYKKRENRYSLFMFSLNFLKNGRQDKYRNLIFKFKYHMKVSIYIIEFANYSEKILLEELNFKQKNDFSISFDKKNKKGLILAEKIRSLDLEEEDHFILILTHNKSNKNNEKEERAIGKDFVILNNEAFQKQLSLVKKICRQQQNEYSNQMQEKTKDGISDEDFIKELKELKEMKVSELNELVKEIWKKRENGDAKEKIKNILNECARVKSKKNSKYTKEELFKDMEKEYNLSDLISKEKRKKIYNGKGKIKPNIQVEKLINILLEENIWILGYDFKLNNEEYKEDTGDEGAKTWKPDLVVKNKDGTNIFFELKQANEEILRYDKSHSCYYFSSAISKGISQLENQMADYIENSKNGSSKNDTLYLIIGNKNNELERELNKGERKKFENIEEAKKARKKDLNLLRNSFKNIKIIFYDEI